MIEIECTHCTSKGPHGVHSKANGRYLCKNCGHTFRRSMALQHKATERANGNRFVITSAVSGSKAHKPFLSSLKAYCDANASKLLIVPIAYRNPTSNIEKPHEWFDPSLSEFMESGRIELCDGLILMADVSTQPTAIRPLSGMQNLSGTSSAIYGHPKIALESVATSLGGTPRLILTTGAVTVPEYSNSKAGKKGEFHHVLGAVIVESDTDGWHVRHVNAKQDGSFFDLDKRYTGKSIEQSANVKVLTLGDLHGVRHDSGTLDATVFGESSLVRILSPELIVLHDVLDFQAASHHNDFFTSLGLYHAKTIDGLSKTDVAAELYKTIELIDRIAESTTANILIVPSNHDAHFYKWLEDSRNAHDLQNAEVYHETKLELIRGQIKQQPIDPFEYWARKVMKHFDRVRFLRYGESFQVDGVEYGQHGDKGINGARGSIIGFTKSGSKMVIGHSHTPGIADGVYQCGTSSLLDMGYNKGMSGWRHTHCVQYSNGKRTLIHIVNGKWRAN